MKMVTRCGGFAGTKSTAPWTVLKSPLPSAATTTRVELAAGGAALVVKVQAWSVVKPGEGAAGGGQDAGIDLDDVFVAVAQDVVVRDKWSPRCRE